MSLVIRPAGVGDLDAFFTYLDDHLRDNGANGAPLFQPLPRAASCFPPERQASFRDGAAIPVGEPGWRRLWLAFDGARIAGHIDLRARPEPASAHRCLLGMGVDRDYRRHGLGQRLIGAAVEWASAQRQLTWIDLEVLSVNAPARALYARAGFVQTGELADMFRIDGVALGYAYMSRQLHG